MWEVVSAYFLDLLIGDPRFPLHPVRVIGRAIEGMGKWLRRAVSNQRAAGIVLGLVIVGTTYTCTWMVLFLCGLAGQWFRFGMGALFIYFALSVRDLDIHSRAVYGELKKGNIEAARDKLSRIVGRDTEGLNEDEIVRAVVESIAESTVDGIVSPLFYAFIGGAPLAMAFKAVSTLDSMVGYKNEKYTDFGWFSARLDDVFNYIPARLSTFLIPLACSFAGLDGAGSFKTALRDGGKSPSPNAGIPEAGFAGALGIQLGGTNTYGGKAAEKPLIGEPAKPRIPRDILRASRLMYTVSAVAVIIGGLILWIGAGL